MLNIGHIANTVQKNCYVSDAIYAGNYSMCIFLLKMREYFRWEHDIPFSQTLPKNEVGEWLVEREQAWEKIDSENYTSIPLATGLVDPFDAQTINAEIVPSGYIYSSGYGIFNKPHFFLGQLLKHEKYKDMSIYVSSCEYARDLVAPPAMSIGNTIFIRQESIRRFIWEKIEEWRWKKRPDVPMGRVMACYSAQQDIDAVLDQLTRQETETMILHEFGEVMAGHILGTQWEEMLSSLSRSKAEFLVRAVRDHLADCLSTLPTLLEQDNRASLHFYFANFTGMRKSLFPEAQLAYQEWTETGDLKHLREVTKKGADKWQSIAQAVTNLHQSGQEGLEGEIEDLIDKTIEPAQKTIHASKSTLQ
jgi:hypothetical protein